MHYVFELVFAEHTVVNEDASQIFTDGFVQKNRTDRRVNSSTQSEDNPVVAQFFFNSATVASTKEAALQSCLPPQMSTTKFLNS